MKKKPVSDLKHWLLDEERPPTSRESDGDRVAGALDSLFDTPETEREALERQIQEETDPEKRKQLQKLLDEVAESPTNTLGSY